MPLCSTIHNNFLAPETLNNPENSIFPDYWHYPNFANRNGYRIWILQVKIHSLKKDLTLDSIEIIKIQRDK